MYKYLVITITKIYFPFYYYLK